MRPIDRNSIQAELDNRLGQELYLHLETTTGSYTKLGPEKKNPVIAFVRNARISYARGTVTGSGPYRVGLKLDEGWVYADGLTDYDVNERGELLLAGLDCEGQLTMALQLSATPFREGQTDAE
ncbi:MAG TPA: YojF family protein [Trueperaceae bacterium]|nr:YojF family protein [Trueperaceae bacterium]